MENMLEMSKFLNYKLHIEAFKKVKKEKILKKITQSGMIFYSLFRQIQTLDS